MSQDLSKTVEEVLAEDSKKLKKVQPPHPLPPIQFSPTKDSKLRMPKGKEGGAIALIFCLMSSVCLPALGRDRWVPPADRGSADSSLTSGSR